LLEHWIAEEASLEFSYNHFWKAQRIPKAGESYFMEGDGPMIDPEMISLNDLAEDEVASNALDLWENRKKSLEVFRNELEMFPQSKQGIVEMLAKIEIVLDNDKIKQFYTWSEDLEGSKRIIFKALRINSDQFNQGWMPVFRK
jgi:hypothetical protein